MAQFPKSQINGEAGERPSHIISNDEDSFTYLNIRGQGFNLSDKGLDGASSTALLTPWVWLERGVYRPNDTAHILWRFQDQESQAYHSTPLWLEVRRPDGQIIHEQSLSPDKSGTYSYEYFFSPLARLGQWQFSLSLGKDGELLSDVDVLVDSITPRQIDATLQETQFPQVNEDYEITLNANWLYGAPATDILTNAKARITASEQPFSKWKDWQIGRHKLAPLPDNIELADETTDAKGDATFTIAIPEATQTVPEKLTVYATLNPLTGKPINLSHSQLIHRTLPYAAIKVDNHTLEAALLNSEGALQSGKLHWTLQPIHYDAYWAYDGNRWQYQNNTTYGDPIADGELTLDTQSPTKITLPISSDSGQDYYLNVEGDNPLTAADLTLRFGNQANPTTYLSPALINIHSDQTHYQQGDTVRLHLHAPFNGLGSLQIAKDGDIISTQAIEFKNGETELSLRWQDDWQRGIWLLASGWNTVQDGNSNRRAVGLHWLGETLTEETLPLTVTAPDMLNPIKPLTVTLHADTNGEPAWANVAIIDDGLYQLAEKTFHSPLNAFYGKKRWQLELFDLWGGILKQTDAPKAALQSGADAEMMMAALENPSLASLPDIDLKLISLWSGVQPLDKDGNLHLTFPIDAQFNGRLRLMAAAFNDKRYGITEQTLTVKSPIVSTLYLPNYLTEGDESTLQLSLHNTTEQPQSLTITIDNDNTHLNIDKSALQTITLAPDESQILSFPYQAIAAGNTSLNIQVKTDKQTYTLTRKLTIRAQTLPVVQREILKLAPNSEETITPSADTLLMLMGVHPWAAADITQQLSQYPYQCTEQLTARAWGAFNQPEQRNQLINKIYNRQHYDGGFSLWYNGDSELWLSAAVADLLLSAETQPEKRSLVLKRTLSYLENQVFRNQIHEPDAGLAYAHLMLAKGGANTRGTLIRYTETLPPKLPLAPTSINLALALYEMGENERAQALLHTINASQDYKSLVNLPYYASGERTQAAALLYRLEQLSHFHSDEQINQWIADTEKQLSVLLENSYYLSTANLAWLARIDLQTPTPKADVLTLNGSPISTPTTLRHGQYSLGNQGKNPLLVQTRYFTTPNPESTIENGIKVKWKYTTIKGKPLNPAALAVNQDMIIHFTIDREDAYQPAQLALNYPFTAGIQAFSLSGNSGNLDAFQNENWYKKLSIPNSEENRDDRHIAVFTLDKDQHTLSHALLLRTTREGKWYAPGIHVNNLYQPEQQASYPYQIMTIGKSQ